MRKTMMGFILLDVLPSVWINAGMLYNLYFAATIPGGAVDDAGSASDSNESKDVHNCRRCQRLVLPFDGGG